MERVTRLSNCSRFSFSFPSISFPLSMASSTSVMQRPIFFQGREASSRSRSSVRREANESVLKDQSIPSLTREGNLHTSTFSSIEALLSFSQCSASITWGKGSQRWKRESFCEIIALRRTTHPVVASSFSYKLLLLFLHYHGMEIWPFCTTEAAVTLPEQSITSHACYSHSAQMTSDTLLCALINTGIAF